MNHAHREADLDPVDVPPEEIAPTAEQLDEDELGADPVEEGMDPPEHWEGAIRYAQSPARLRRGPRIEQRLAAEEPDLEP
ncbi:hypothetical protein [Nocardia stercoris]|uniref:DUF5709 domain-containing protein n=1 Tax=Nocardia stercoris TaxID=2483361 RepID=A0A3M2L154_9NOCA|nr:hypothetical protein [Nocardia stercoris]RMI31301.1 hypothetical protein EBN03_18225 [Nocardia stercoris]